MRTKVKLLAVAALVLSLTALPLVGFAQEIRPAENWREPLRPLWDQAQALRTQRAELAQQVRAQHQVNAGLAAGIRAAVEANTLGIRALAAQLQAFVEGQIRPLRQQAASLREALAQAIRDQNRELARSLRAELAGGMEQLSVLQAQARELQNQLQALRQAAAPRLEVAREMRLLLAPLKDQAQAILDEIHGVRAGLQEELEKLRGHAAKQDVQACEQSLERIIGYENQLIALNQQLLALEQQSEQILQNALSQLEG
ncbi:MAG: hypothetical protein Q8P31_01310 [Bacillota bacterium]|nr:hypothetical protein [Bacillota bacterium]